MNALLFGILFVVVFVCSSGIQGTGIAHNYLDEMAHSYCAANNKGWVFSLRRNCGGTAPTCNQMCKEAQVEMLGSIGNQRKRVVCFDAFYISKEHSQLSPNLGSSSNQPDAGKNSMRSYGYGKGGCTWKPNHCGPNYCCCKGY